RKALQALTQGDALGGLGLQIVPVHDLLPVWSNATAAWSLRLGVPMAFEVMSQGHALSNCRSHRHTCHRIQELELHRLPAWQRGVLGCIAAPADRGSLARRRPCLNPDTWASLAASQATMECELCRACPRR